jgi:hypothetical protein
VVGTVSICASGRRADEGRHEGQQGAGPELHRQPAGGVLTVEGRLHWCEVWWPAVYVKANKELDFSFVGQYQDGWEVEVHVDEPLLCQEKFEC